EVEVVGANDGSVALRDTGRLDPLFHVFAAVHHRSHPIVERDGGRTGRAREALLQAGGGHVDLPAVHFERIAAQRSRTVDVEQHVVPATQGTDLGKWLQHSG